jgi:phenylacetaldehyde dehydrogenase
MTTIATGRSTLLSSVRSFLSSPKQLLIDGAWVNAADGAELR